MPEIGDCLIISKTTCSIPIARELRGEGRLLPIEPKVFDLLVHLISNRDRVVSKDDLITTAWDGRIVLDRSFY